MDEVGQKMGQMEESSGLKMMACWKWRRDGEPNDGGNGSGVNR